MAYPTLELPAAASVNTAMLEPPLPPDEAARVELVKGPNIASLPELRRRCPTDSRRRCC